MHLAESINLYPAHTHILFYVNQKANEKKYFKKVCIVYVGGGGPEGVHLCSITPAVGHLHPGQYPRPAAGQKQ